MKRYKLVILGGGLAAATTLTALAKEKAAAGCALISAEPEVPYDRPPLSKDYLLGKLPREKVTLKPQAFYAENDVDLYLSERATAVDPTARRIVTDKGTEVSFENLMIAAGSELRVLSIPGSDLEGIFYLRTIGDSEALQRVAAAGWRAVVVGAGFIGLEVACALRQKSLEVTVLELSDTVLPLLRAPELSGFFLDSFRRQGVEFVLGESARQFEGDGTLRSVRTSAGKSLPCDLAVVGVGVRPATAFLEGSGLDLQDGVVVNEFMETNVPGIFAAGDVANYFDPVYQRRRRIEHWDNAIKQGKVVAQGLLGARQPYAGVSYFYSDVWDLHWQLIGDHAGCEERLVRGSVEESKFGVLYLRDGVLRAMFLLGLPFKERRAAEKLIIEKVSVRPHLEKLRDPTFSLEQAMA